MDPVEFSKKFHLILASKSPRRKMLLEHAGFRFEVRTKENDEQFPASLKAGAIPEFLSLKKADDFRNELKKGELLITADTIVWLKGKVLNKPEDREDAVRMLCELEGNTHEVFSGITLSTTSIQKTIVVRSAVSFRPLSVQQIEQYVDSCQPFDKAGAYGAQEFIVPGVNVCSMAENAFAKEIGSKALQQDCYPAENTHLPVYGVEKIEGSYFNVMGFPIVEAWEEMKNLEL